MVSKPFSHGEKYHKSNHRLRKEEVVLQKKSRGRLIHVSDFINAETGRLVIKGEDGSIKEDARTIIYPSSQGDKWWDMEQLLVQMKKMIKIFEKAHPDATALFIFDNSSSHTALAPDALHAFEMNKSNGGKQRHQHDTVIPASNPDPRYHGQVQKMTDEQGQPKGLKQVLEERGFDVSGM